MHHWGVTVRLRSGRVQVGSICSNRSCSAVVAALRHLGPHITADRVGSLVEVVVAAASAAEATAYVKDLLGRAGLAKLAGDVEAATPREFVPPSPHPILTN